MSPSARRPRFQSRDLLKLRAEAKASRAAAKARRTAMDTFFRGHLSDVRRRLSTACKPYDDARYYWRKKHIRETHDQDHDRSAFRPSGACRRPQLSEIEGDEAGQ